MFAISVDPPQTAEALRQRLNCSFTFLSDPAGTVLDRLNIRHRDGHDGHDIAYPTQILVDKDGIVRWTYQSDNLRVRVRPAEIFTAIASLPR